MPAELRILDASANRVREALRVLEDIARFGLDDGELAELLKGLRHEFQAAVGGLVVQGVGGRALVEGRDVSGDVGTAIRGAGEGTRQNLVDIAAAAGSRLTEALRSMEEMCKALGSMTVGGDEAWEVFEALRYRAYDVQRRLVLMMAPPARQWRVCVLITEALCAHHRWDEVARLAVEGGADCLQLREKELESRELLSRARRLVEIAGPRGASVIVNDRPDIALLSGADGVHLGQGDLAVADVRRLGARPIRRLLVGVSCSMPDQVRRAVEDGADYLGLGPMFPSSTKPKEVLAGPALLGWVAAEHGASRLPHLAISGIAADNVGLLVAEGCRGVAVSGAVCSSEDPAGAVRALRSAWDGSAGERA